MWAGPGLWQRKTVLPKSAACHGTSARRTPENSSLLSSSWVETAAGLTSAAAKATPGRDCSPSRPALSVVPSATPEAAAAGTRALQVQHTLTSALQLVVCREAETSLPQTCDDQLAQSWPRCHTGVKACICMAGQRREQPASGQAAAAACLKPRRTASLHCCVLVRPLPGSHCSEGRPIRAAWLWRSGIASCRGGSRRRAGSKTLIAAERHAAWCSSRSHSSHQS